MLARRGVPCGCVACRDALDGVLPVENSGVRPIWLVGQELTDVHLGFSALGDETMADGAPGRPGGRIRGTRFAAREPRRSNENGPGGPNSGTAVITRTRTQTRKPSMYRVLLLNDDYTPMEFVVTVLRKYFNKGTEEANRIMLHVHQHGVGECGIFTYEVAETKVTQVMDYARKHQHPLQCIMEKK